MNEKRIIQGITLLTILVFSGVIIGWHVQGPRQDFSIQAPGADNRPEGLERKADDVKIGEFFMRYAEENSSVDSRTKCTFCYATKL